VIAAALRDWVNAQVGKTQRLSAVEVRERAAALASGQAVQERIARALLGRPNHIQVTS
jgi:ABC-type transport system involved in cytochrome bd biosynthesis fused ATPase/permease subunit